MFSGGTYQEVDQWLRNFVVSRAKRVDPRLEAEVTAGGERERQSYGVALRLGSLTTPVVELSYREAADNRGSLRWCTDLAGRIEAMARELCSRREVADARRP